MTDSTMERFSGSELERQPKPIAAEVGVIALVSNRWGEQWQNRHQVLSRLGRYFKVVWVNPAPGWREAWTRPANLRVTDSRPEPGLHIHSPDRVWARFHRPGWLTRFTARKRLEGARKLLVREGCTKIVLYIWRPEFSSALSILRHDWSCYHIDDEYTFATEDLRIPDEELALLQTVDQVFIHSPGLLEKKGHVNSNTHFVPNGVDFAAHAEPCDEPTDLAGIAGPRIGYTGWLKNQLNWDLLEALAPRHPDWSFVFVGSVKPHPGLEDRLARFGRLSNVYLLGGKSSQELARYPQHFDVCLMPYNDDDYTRYIYPLKLHEYLAAGTPTVGTPIRSLESFRAVIELASGPDEWSAAIESALGDHSPARNRERQEVARAHDWRGLVHRVAQNLADGLGPEIAKRVRSS